MTWSDHDLTVTSGEYRIFRTTRGHFSAWHYGDAYRRLHADLPTLAQAKSICHQHAQRISPNTRG